VGVGQRLREDRVVRRGEGRLDLRSEPALEILLFSRAAIGAAAAPVVSPFLKDAG
jgi:hypothetical protein